MIYCLARRFITRWEASLKPERFRESWVPADNYSQIEDGFAATMNMPENDFATVKETAWLYVIVICLVGFGILLSLYAGRNLKPARFSTEIVAQEEAHLPQSAATATGDLTAGLRHNATGALGRLFIQLGVILGQRPPSVGSLQGSASQPWSGRCWPAFCWAHRSSGSSLQGFSTSFSLPRPLNRCGFSARSGFAFLCSP